MLLADICFIFWLFSEVTLAHTRIAQVALALMSVAALALMVRQKSIRISYWMILAALIVAWNAIGAFAWSIERTVSLLDVRTLCINLAFFGLLFQYLVIKNDLEQLFLLFILAFVAVVAYVLIRSGFVNLLSLRLGHLAGINPNGLGIFTSVIFAFSLYKVFSRRFWWLLPLVLSAVVSLLAFSFTALAGVACIIIFFIPFVSPKRWGLKLAGVILLGIGLLFLVAKLWPLAGNKLTSSLLALRLPPEPRGSSIGVRRWLIQFGIEKFIERPITGYGSNCYYILDGMTRGWDVSTYAHNNYVELLVNGGLVCFLLYYAIPVVAIIRSFRRRLVKGLSSHTVLVGVCLSLLLMDMGTVSYFNRVLLLPHVMLIASLFAQHSTAATKWLYHDLLPQKNVRLDSQDEA